MTIGMTCEVDPYIRTTVSGTRWMKRLLLKRFNMRRRPNMMLIVRLYVVSGGISYCFENMC